MYDNLTLRELYHLRNKYRALGALFIFLLPMMGLGIEKLIQAAKFDRLIKERGIKNEERESTVIICSGTPKKEET